jgi:hypothetical protein
MCDSLFFYFEDQDDKKRWINPYYELINIEIITQLITSHYLGSKEKVNIWLYWSYHYSN